MWDWLLNLFGGASEAAPVASSPAEALSGVGFGAPVAEAAGAGGTSFGDVASSLYGGTRSALSGFGDVAKAVLPAAQLGGAVMSGVEGYQAGKQLSEQTKIAGRAAKTQASLAEAAKGAAMPLTEFSQEELARAGRGEIPPAIQAQIELWKQGAKQHVQDYAARSGQGDSSQLVNWLAWIDQQAEAMAAEALMGEQQMGITAGGTAGSIIGAGASAAGGAGQAAAGQQHTLTSLISAANQELGRLAGGAS
jgi:hypothetical protein